MSCKGTMGTRDNKNRPRGGHQVKKKQDFHSLYVTIAQIPKWKFMECNSMPTWILQPFILDIILSHRPGKVEKETSAVGASRLLALLKFWCPLTYTYWFLFQVNNFEWFEMWQLLW